MLRLLLVSIICLIDISAMAAVYNLPPKNNDVIGSIQTYTIKDGDTFPAIAQKFNVTYTGMMEANPYVDPQKLKTGTHLVIPSAIVLPDAPRKGIVINLAELRLFYYPPKQKVVYSFPVGIGIIGWNITPGKMKIVEKQKDPTWYVPKAVHKELEEKGYHIPFVIPPGPDNPLGGYMMRLSARTYLIHGVVDPSTVGRRSSSGCFRMYPEDIKTLFDIVPVGTSVEIVDQPYKVGRNGNKLVLEAHVPLQEQPSDTKNFTPLINRIADALGTANANVNWDHSFSLLQEANGVPAEIGILN